MKTKALVSLHIIATIATLADASAGSLTNFAIGLSPAYAVPESEQIERGVKKFVLDAPKGSRIRVDDAFNLRSIVIFAVPDFRYDSPANRLRTLASSFGTLTLWFKQARTNAAVTTLTNIATLRVPEYLDFLAGDGGEPRGILLMGSPFAQYQTEPTFSMTGSEEGPRVPSDGNLLASLTASPYGCAERKGRLRGCQISWCYGNEDVWANGLHKTLVARFWTLFIKQQNATLVCFTGDLGAAFVALPQGGHGAVANFELNPDDSKIQMPIARPRQVPTWLQPAGNGTNAVSGGSPAQGLVTATQTTNSATVSAGRELTAPARPETPPLNLTAPVASTVDIGIMWESSDAQLDLDLYVRPGPGAQELWYQKARTAEGVYVRDWTEPNNRTDFEWVKLKPGVRLGEVEAWVNLFKGRGPISGRVAVHYQNRVYTGSFHISAASGNDGIDARSRQNSPHWTRLNLQQILTQNQ